MLSATGLIAIDPMRALREHRLRLRQDAKQAIQPLVEALLPLDGGTPVDVQIIIRTNKSLLRTAAQGGQLMPAPQSHLGSPFL